jgi:hypothetical protein
VRDLRHARNDCWHRAQRLEPEEKRSTDELSEGESRWSCVRRRATAARPTPDETGAEFHGAPPIVRAEYAPDGRKVLVIAARAAHIAKRYADRCLGVPWRDALAEALLPEAIYHDMDAIWRKYHCARPWRPLWPSPCRRNRPVRPVLAARGKSIADLYP